MCGIAGIVMKNGASPDPAVLDAFGRALAHRGPDGVKTYVKGAVGLVHRRLAIIDPEGGDQPLFGAGGSALVGNGEIYNYRELHAEQEGRFDRRTGSDFEPAVNLLDGEGTAALAALRGMYALAMHRPARGDLLLARDPFGIKPLYVFEDETLFAFASEPRAFFAAGIATPVLDPGRRDELLQLQYTTEGETIFRGIRRLMPGTGVTLVGGSVVASDRRQAVPPVAGLPPANLDEAVARFDRAFEESVRLHQRSDVPYGMFLSAGADSTAILTMMARLNPRPVLAFTCGFEGAEVHDERADARRVARALGAEHVEVSFDEDDFWNLLPGIVEAFDEPTTDYAILPTFKLGAVARRHVKVILSGEGGDEMLAGYGRYRYLLKPWWRGGKRPKTKGMFAGLGVLRDEGRSWAAGIDGIRRCSAEAWPVPLQAAQATDVEGWLHADLLLKLDRALMAHGVEGRTPFLDPGVAAACFHLPDRFKIARDTGKYLLRTWLARNCPAAEPFSRKKGFTVPVGQWIARRAGEIGPLVARSPAVEAICRPGSVEKLFSGAGRANGRAAWTLLFYALWHRRHIEGAAVCGDAREALAA